MITATDYLIESEISENIDALDHELALMQAITKTPVEIEISHKNIDLIKDNNAPHFISYNVFLAGNVSIEVFNANEKVKTLINENHSEGFFSLIWNSANEQNGEYIISAFHNEILVFSKKVIKN